LKYEKEFDSEGSDSWSQLCSTDYWQISEDNEDVTYLEGDLYFNFDSLTYGDACPYPVDEVGDDGIAAYLPTTESLTLFWGD
jgi:hypothetical protein